MNNINDLKYNNYKKQKIMKYLVIGLSFLTIVLESFALFGMISYLWGLIPFASTYFIKYLILKNDKENKDGHKK